MRKVTNMETWELKGSHCCDKPDHTVFRSLGLVCMWNVEGFGTLDLKSLGCCRQNLVGQAGGKGDQVSREA